MPHPGGGRGRSRELSRARTVHDWLHRRQFIRPYGGEPRLWRLLSLKAPRCMPRLIGPMAVRALKPKHKSSMPSAFRVGWSRLLFLLEDKYGSSSGTGPAVRGAPRTASNTRWNAELPGCLPPCSKTTPWRSSVPLGPPGCMRVPEWPCKRLVVATAVGTSE
jgi:hypothetical protein